MYEIDLRAQSSCSSIRSFFHSTHGAQFWNATSEQFQRSEELDFLLRQLVARYLILNEDDALKS